MQVRYQGEARDAGDDDRFEEDVLVDDRDVDELDEADHAQAMCWAGRVSLAMALDATLRENGVLDAPAVWPLYDAVSVGDPDATRVLICGRRRDGREDVNEMLITDRYAYYGGPAKRCEVEQMIDHLTRWVDLHLRGEWDVAVACYDPSMARDWIVYGYREGGYGLHMALAMGRQLLCEVVDHARLWMEWFEEEAPDHEAMGAIA